MFLKKCFTDSPFFCGFELSVCSLAQSAGLIKQLACYGSEYPLGGALAALQRLKGDCRLRKNVKITETQCSVPLCMQLSLTHYIRKLEGKWIAVLQEEKQQEALRHWGNT